MAEASMDESSKPGFGMRLAIASISKRFRLARNISTHWLDQRLRGGQGSPTTLPPVKILDCRAENEYDVSHIEGAIRIDYESSPEEILKTAGIDQTSNDPLDVVCYCSVGYRSSLVAQKLQDYVRQTTGAQKNGMSFFNLEGSLFKWANENRHMTNSEGTDTKFAHPYNAVFGKLLNSELRKS